MSYDNASQLTMCENNAADDDDASGQPAPGARTTEDGSPGPHAPDGRTEALINRGRPPAGRSRTRWLRSHLRLVAIAVASLLIAALIVWQLVLRYVVARLSELCHSMLAIARGDLATPLSLRTPSRGDHDAQFRIYKL